ncbi:MAG: hypothetical protein IKZ28_00115 [Clostridia bacterium]|nr:hypothetical protein [Clostridia bacterium]
MQGLKISPCIPDEWEQVCVQRVFRNCTYEIAIDNRARKGNCVKEILVDGVKIEGDVVAPSKDGLKIEVVMG